MSSLTANALIFNGNVVLNSNGSAYFTSETLGTLNVATISAAQLSANTSNVTQLLTVQNLAVLGNVTGITIGGGGISSSSIANSTDANITNLSNNQLLTYNANTHKWMNANLTAVPNDLSINGNVIIVGSYGVAGANSQVAYVPSRSSLGVVGTGNNRTWWTIDDQSIAPGGGGSGASVQFTQNNTGYWEVINAPQTVGTYAPSNDSLRFYYDGTNPGTALSIYGSGRVATSNVTVDDGLGNMSVANAVTINNTTLLNTSALSPNPLSSVQGGTLNGILQQYNGTLTVFNFVVPTNYNPMQSTLQFTLTTSTSSTANFSMVLRTPSPLYMYNINYSGTSYNGPYIGPYANVALVPGQSYAVTLYVNSGSLATPTVTATLTWALPLYTNALTVSKQMVASSDVVLAGGSGYGIKSINAAGPTPSGGAYVDALSGNIGLLGGNAQSSWSVVDQNAQPQFQVYNTLSGTTGGAVVRTYNTVLDDGSGNLNAPGVVTATGANIVGTASALRLNTLNASQMAAMSGNGLVTLNAGTGSLARYGGNGWQTVLDATSSIGQLRDVTLSNLTANQVLTYSGNAWVNAAATPTGTVRAFQLLDNVSPNAAVSGNVVPSTWSCSYTNQGGSSVVIDAVFSCLTNTVPSVQTAYLLMDGTVIDSTSLLFQVAGEHCSMPPIFHIRQPPAGAHTYAIQLSGALQANPNDFATLRLQEFLGSPQTAANLASLSDVRVSAPSTGQILAYYNNAWTNMSNNYNLVKAVQLLDSVSPAAGMVGPGVPSGWSATYTSSANSIVMVDASLTCLATTPGFYTANLVLDGTVVDSTGFLFSTPNVHCTLPAIYNVVRPSAGTHTYAIQLSSNSMQVTTNDVASITVQETMSGFTQAASTSIQNLSDTNVNSPSSGQTLVYTNGAWTNSNVGASGRLATLSDVSVTALANNQLLSYNLPTSQWVNVTNVVVPGSLAVNTALSTAGNVVTTRLNTPDDGYGNLKVTGFTSLNTASNYKATTGGEAVLSLFGAAPANVVFPQVAFGFGASTQSVECYTTWNYNVWQISGSTTTPAFSVGGVSNGTGVSGLVRTKNSKLDDGVGNMVVAGSVSAGANVNVASNLTVGSSLVMYNGASNVTVACAPPVASGIVATTTPTATCNSTLTSSGTGTGPSITLITYVLPANYGAMFNFTITCSTSSTFGSSGTSTVAISIGGVTNTVSINFSTTFTFSTTFSQSQLAGLSYTAGQSVPITAQVTTGVSGSSGMNPPISVSMTFNYLTLATTPSLSVSCPVTSVGQAWVAPTLLNSWVNYSASTTPLYTPAGYLVDACGYVLLRGLVRSGTIGTVVFTLPASVSPAYVKIFIVDSTSAVGEVRIQGTEYQESGSAAGQVLIAAGSNTWVSLDGIRFLIGS